MKEIETILTLIKEDCLDIQDFVTGIDKKRFFKNTPVNKAVCMSLLSIGELIKTLPEDFFDRYPQAPWKEIAGINTAAHENKRLDLEMVWTVAGSKIQEILSFIESYLKTNSLA